MASPFSIFRKNQKVMMAVLIGLSMIAFILLDSINATNFPIFLGAILGALALWLLSGKSGAEGWLIAVVGAVLGAIVGVYGPGFLGNDTAIYTAEGNLSQREIEEISRNQDTANQFLSLAYRTVIDKVPEDQRRQITPPMPFGIVNVADSATMRENAVLTYLFSHEADKLGIEVTDEAVSQFIVETTDSKLNDADLRRIRTQMQIGTGSLIDILREQLRVRGAYQLLSPISGVSLGPATPTPLQLWNDFKKLKAEAEVAAVALPVEDFVAQVKEPTSEELTRFFEEYKAVPPAGDGTPGFLVPRQVQVAYLEMPFDEVKKTVPQPTDEEILQFYEKNKSRFEFKPNIEAPAGSTSSDSDEQPVNDEPNPEGAANPASDAAETKEGESADAVPSSSSPETPTQQESEGSDATSPEEAPGPSLPETPQGESESRIDLKGSQFVMFQGGEATPPAEANRPSPESNADPEGTDAPPSDTPPSDTPPSDTPPSDTPPSDTPPSEPAPSAPSPAETDQPGAGPSENMGPTEEIRATIREEILDQRARAAADARLEVVRTQVDEIILRVMDAVPIPQDSRDEEQRSSYEKERRTAIRKVVDQLREFAEKNKELKFAVTPLLSGQDLLESDDYPVGSAIRWEKSAPLFNRDQTPVAEIIFSMSPEQPLLPVVAQSPLNDSRYVALKVDDQEPHVPALKDEGIEAKVVEAWKLRRAREMAQERAEQIAKKASSEKKDLAAVIAGETITGEEDAPELTVRDVGPFTWLRRSTAPSQDFAPPQIVPTTLPQLPGVGGDFMQSVFQDLKVGETGTAPTVDGSRWYVIELKKRASEQELASARDEFIREDFFESPLDAILGQPMNPFRRQTLMEAFELRSQWFDDFRKQHEVIDPENPVVAPAA